MKEKLSLLKLEMDWLERLDVTCDVEKQDEKNSDSGKMAQQDDFKREMKL